MFHLFSNWFGRTEEEKKANVLGGPEAGDLVASIKENKCPDCGHEGFWEGPSGGINTNIICKNDACGSKFNIAGFAGELIFAERLGAPSPKKGT